MAPLVPAPGPVPEVPMVEKLLQRLVAEKQRRQPAPVIPAEPGVWRNCSDHTSRGSRLRDNSLGRDPPNSLGRDPPNEMVCFSCGKAGHRVVS